MHHGLTDGDEVPTLCLNRDLIERCAIALPQFLRLGNQAGAGHGSRLDVRRHPQRYGHLPLRIRSGGEGGVGQAEDGAPVGDAVEIEHLGRARPCVGLVRPPAQKQFPVTHLTHPPNAPCP